MSLCFVYLMCWLVLYERRWTEVEKKKAYVECTVLIKIDVFERANT